MTEKRFTGRDIIAAGFNPGPHMRTMIAEANENGYIDVSELSRHLTQKPEYLPFQDPQNVVVLANSENVDEEANIAAVKVSLTELTRTPGVRAAVGLPDACPAGPMGTITVGGVAVSENIHPGMHSADVCCSMAMSVFDMSPKDALDKIHSVTHFGAGGRGDVPMPSDVWTKIMGNRITEHLANTADHHFGTQGDGNHFAYVGILRSTGKTVLVTHHGSRGFGAKVYKEGKRIADTFRKDLCPEVMPDNAWIPVDTKEADDYWNALQIVREWTKANHFVLHDMVGKAEDRFWNEHNFVFRKSDGLFYHAKGATPAFPGWAEDSSGLSLIPLNMAEPILIARGLDNPVSFGFAPHGAGRNFSRSEHRRRELGDFEEETRGIDCRFFSGIPDMSELPSGYKNAKSVKSQIEEFGLAEIVDEIIPYGSIMAGGYNKRTR